MKVFKFIVVSILTLITIQTAYFALLYKANTATGAFLICLGITLFVACDGGLERIKPKGVNKKENNKKLLPRL